MEEETTIIVTCPKCKRLMTVPEAAEGSEARCPGCNEWLVVPRANVSVKCDKCGHCLAFSDTVSEATVLCPQCNESVSLVPQPDSEQRPVEVDNGTNVGEPPPASNSNSTAPRTSADEQYFYANDKNEPQGPYDLAQLEKLRADGIVTEGTYVIPENGKEWQPLTRVFAVAKLPSHPPPPARVCQRPPSPESGEPVVGIVPPVLKSPSMARQPETGVADVNAKPITPQRKMTSLIGLGVLWGVALFGVLFGLLIIIAYPSMLIPLIVFGIIFPLGRWIYGEGQRHKWVRVVGIGLRLSLNGFILLSVVFLIIAVLCILCLPQLFQ